jgi:tetratricopeptide (TPR) repeat protein
MKEFKFRLKVEELPKNENQMALTGKELEKLFLKKLKERNGMCKETMWCLARLYGQTNRLRDAVIFISKILTLSENNEERSECFLALGGIMEKINGYAQAAEYYREAFLLKSSNKNTWYFTNNNLGYCLNQLQRFEEAKNYLFTAIKTDPTRSNAYKNLGLCFQGLGEYRKAAKCFITAIKVNGSDTRPMNHLKNLLQEHSELFDEIPDLEEKVDACKKVVEHARTIQPDFNFYWNELRNKFN